MGTEQTDASYLSADVTLEVRSRMCVKWLPRQAAWEAPETWASSVGPEGFQKNGKAWEWQLKECLKAFTTRNLPIC